MENVRCVTVPYILGLTDKEEEKKDKNQREKKGEENEKENKQSPKRYVVSSSLCPTSFFDYRYILIEKGTITATTIQWVGAQKASRRGERACQGVWLELKKSL